MSDFKTNKAAVELFQVIFDNGGTMELGQAFAGLRGHSRNEVVARYGKVSKMITKFPNHFTKDCSKRKRNVVEVKIPLEFCPDAGKTTAGCVTTNCQKLHLCTHFIMGTCTFGEKCRKSHLRQDYIDPRMQRVLKGASLEFMLPKPAILQKLLKKKIEEDEIQMTATSRGIPDTCKHYNHESGCTKGVTCPFLHVCSHYISGDCKFEDLKGGCKREHSFKDPHNMKVLKAYNMYSLRELQILKILQGSDQKRSVGTSSDSIPSETSSHHLAASTSLPRNTTSTGCGIPDTCKHYNHESGCTKGVTCPFLHVCSHYISGDCKFEDLKGGCKREHSFKDPHNMKVLKAYNMYRLRELQILKILQGSDRKHSVGTSSDSIPYETSSHHLAASISLPRNTTSTGRGIPDTCKHYNHESGCTKGVTCPFLHVCSHYISGDCKFKGGCKRKHSFKDPHNMKVLKACNMYRWHELQILQILQGSDRKRSISASSDSIPSETSSHHLAASTSLPRNTTSTGSTANKDAHDICGFHLRGKCYYGDKCVNRHTELPYLWQYCHQYPPGSAAPWEDVSDDLNIMIEETFCDEAIDSSRTTLGKSRYVINFDEMIAKPREATNIPPLKLRRLSTVSSVETSPGHIFSTKWCWYWKDEKNKWQSYDTPDDNHPASTASSVIFEKNFQADKNGVYPFSTSRHKYHMYFAHWHQENDVSQTQRPVRRRSNFVSKEDMSEIAKRKRTYGTKGAAFADSENALPSHWEPMSDLSSGQDFKRVVLQSISDEYKTAEKLFEDTLKGHTIYKIERVQNEDLWMEYIRKKQRLAKKASGEPEEKQLFHGTSPGIVEAICQQGFDWRMCGKHGTAYGKGSYFASTAVYSHKYAKAGIPSDTPLKRMFLAKVVVGSYTTGLPTYMRPPPKDQSKPLELYDSCVDNPANPALYVVFDNGQSYPEILITYI